MTSEELVSQCANDIGDPGFNTLNKKEYIQFMNDTLQEMGMESGCFYGYTEDSTMPEGSNEYTLTVDVVKLLRVEYLFSGSDMPIQMREVDFHRLKNHLHGTDGDYSYEYQYKPTSYTDDNGNVVLTINGPNLNDELLKKNCFAAVRDNNILTLHFSFNFNSGDTLRIYYISAHDPHTNFDNVDVVWNVYASIVQEGMRYRALQRLEFRKDTNDPKIWQYGKRAVESEMKYRQKLSKLRRYINAMSSVDAVAEMKPFKYL